MSRTRIMYIENKSGGLANAGRVGRVTFSKSGLSIYYAGRAFGRLGGNGFKANYFDQQSGEHYRISGPRKDGADGLYGRMTTEADVDTPMWRTNTGRRSGGTSRSDPTRRAGRCPLPLRH